MATGGTGGTGKPPSDFELERYKDILNGIRFLNENVHKYLALFQALTVAILAGGAAIFVGWHELHIPADVARVSIHGLLGLIVVLGLFVVASLLAGLFSWVDYRKEEVALLNRVLGPGARRPPSYANVWRWSETYLLLFVVLVVVVICAFVESQVVPLIHS